MDEMPFSFDMEPLYHMQQTPPKKFSEERSCYKTLNILPLKERIQVIREYERSPNYKRIAEHFNCSTKQIRNIIANKDALLLCAASSNLYGTAQRTRLDKIQFLDKVIYEFILRTLNQHIPINEHVVRTKALEMKETIGIDNFCPYQIWMENFKKTYGIFSLDSSSLRRTLNDSSKEISLSCIDLIQYVSRVERKKEKQARTSTPQVHRFNGVYRRNENEETMSNEDLGEPIVVYENTTDVCCREFKKKGNSNTKTQESMTMNLESNLVNDDLIDDAEMVTLSRENDKSNSISKRERLPEITNYQEALPYLKALEDFALLESNFRAIGLITQLEQAFQNPPKNIDFSN